MATAHPVEHHESLLTGLRSDVDNHEGRLQSLEKVSAVREEQIRNLFVAVGEIKAMVAEILRKPARRWDELVGYIIAAGVGGLVSYLIGVALK